MARMKIHMVDQKEILRLKGLGHSRAEVSKLLKIDRGTVRKYWDVDCGENSGIFLA